jgi:signal transduction histidine kinase
VSSPPRRRIRRYWPQKVRTRLTLLYAGLFLAAGTALLGITYGLAAAALPVRPASVSRYTATQRAKLRDACALPATDPGTVRLCKQAFASGASAGSASQRDRALHSLLLVSLAGLGTMTVISGGLGWVVSGRVLRPVRAITAAARRASDQHLGERLALTGASDELKELADTFDDMLERLDSAFASQRRFVANASHELRTPLTVMRTAIDVTLAKPSPTPQQFADLATRVRRSVDRAEHLIDALLTLAVSEQGPARAEPVDLATSAEDAIDAAAAAIGRLGLRIDTELEPAPTTGDPHLVERMIGNLVDNAVRHNQPGGWVRLRTGASDSTVFLHIANSGPLVPEEAVPALFEPFRRMKERTGTRDGVGLGLCIAQSVAAAHGTTVSARSLPAGGLDISVLLPRRLEASDGPRA